MEDRTTIEILRRAGPDTGAPAKAKDVDLRDSGLWFRQEPATPVFYWQDGGLLAAAVSAGGE